MLTDLKRKTVSGLLWSGFESFAVSAVNFIATILLARLLLPRDFGVVALAFAFLAVGNTIVDFGLSNALIRKKNCCKGDFSSVARFNIVLALAYYVLLWIVAPFVASFFNQVELTMVLRTIGVTLIFNALSIAPHAKLTMRIDFRALTIATFVSILLSGIVGVTMAYNDAGLWSIVWQQIFYYLCRMTLLWIKVGGLSLRRGSVDSFREMLRFGYKLLVASLLDTAYTNLYSLAIGRQYGTVDVGYYSKASNIAGYVPKTGGNIVQRVAFPVMARLQNQGDDLKKTFTKLLELTAFVVFPIMTWLVAMAEDLVVLLLTDKWLSIVPIFQILCLALMLFPIHTLNLTVMQVKGRSDVFLRVEIIKKIVGIIVLFLCLPLGVATVCFGQLSTSIIALTVNSYAGGRMVGVSLAVQVKKLTPILINSTVMALPTITLAHFVESESVALTCGAIVALVTYLGISQLSKVKPHREIISLLRELKNG